MSDAPTIYLLPAEATALQALTVEREQLQAVMRTQVRVPFRTVQRLAALRTAIETIETTGRLRAAQLIAVAPDEIAVDYVALAHTALAAED